VQQIAWSNDRGGSGLANGTTTWSAAISLQAGLNNITVTARDTAGNSTSATLAITYTSGTAPIIAIFSPTSQAAFRQLPQPSIWLAALPVRLPSAASPGQTTAAATAPPAAL